MTFTVLFVCSANVCRSPTAALLASRRLSRASHMRGITVHSAGVAVLPGSRWCRKASDWVEPGEDQQELLAEHRARPLSRSCLDRAGLVLAADLRVHGAVLAASPTSRARLFTIREAAVLGQAVTRAVSRQDGPEARVRLNVPLDVFPMPEDAGPVPRLTWLVEEMNAARGQVAIAPPRGRRLFGRPVSHEAAFDVPDAHGGDKMSHRRVLQTMAEAVDMWAQCVVSACDDVPRR